MIINQLAAAIALASNSHERQVDKAGKPYILHPIRMMMRLRTDDEELMAIAVLHDVVEDTALTHEDLEYLGFSIRIRNGVKALTRERGEDYEDFIQRLAHNRDAVVVKLEDLRDNSDITRLKGLKDKDFKRMEKYHRAYTYLYEVKTERYNLAP